MSESIWISMHYNAISKLRSGILRLAYIIERCSIIRNGQPSTTFSIEISVTIFDSMTLYYIVRFSCDF